jgi:HSP20 family protein
MTLLRSWSPNGLNVQDEMHRMFHDLVLTGEPGLSAWLPAVDVHESDTSYTLQFDLPGVAAQDVRIEMNDGQLTVKGERKSVELEGVNAHRKERVTGTFERSFRLRARVDTDGIKATYKDGVLTIDVPKAKEAVKREIPIQLG